MSVPSPSDLLAFLQEHGFLTPLQVQELGGVHSPKFADTRALAGTLVEREWLTAYQANELLQGRGTTLLVGPYRIVDRLGQGGMAQVFRALHVGMGRVVALKIIPRERLSNPAVVARFEREVRAVATLSHPNIVIAFDVNQAGQTHCLAMEYVDGIDLAKLVHQSGRLPIANACEYIRQAANGLQHAHEKGLVHRDIKPGNLMVTRSSQDQQPVVKILDFGLARFEREIIDGTRLTQLGKIVGTVDYIAPEQAANPQTADIRADIYSLGCSLFYLLTGKPPFGGQDTFARIAARCLDEVPSVRKRRPEVPPELEGVVAKMMARDPRSRYQTPGEVALALAPFTDAGEKKATREIALPPLPGRTMGTGSSRKARSSSLPPRQVATSQESAFAFAPPSATREPERTRRGWTGNAMTYGWLVAGVTVSLCVLLLVGWLVMNRGDKEDRRERSIAPVAIANPEKSAPLDEGVQQHAKPDNPKQLAEEKIGPKINNDLPKEKLPQEITNSIGMQLVRIPAGTFTMGSPRQEIGRGADEDQHEVEVSEFHLGVYEVTQRQYLTVMGNNPSSFSKNGSAKEKVKGMNTDNFPVENVSNGTMPPISAPS